MAIPERIERVDSRDSRVGRADAFDHRSSSAAFSRDALETMRLNNSMVPPQLDAMGRSNSQLSRAGYPPPLTLENSVANPDQEAWRRSNPFDKHYVGRGAGAIGPYDRSPNPQYRTDGAPQEAPAGNYRVASNNFEPRYGQSPYAGNNQYENPYRRTSLDQSLPPADRYPRVENSGTVFRSSSDRNSFYAPQNDGNSCSAFSMAMMCSDWSTGRPASNAESSRWKQIAGTIGHGYRGTLDQVASNLRQGIPDLHTKVYNYGMGRVGPQAMQDLNRELAQGHTAVAKVINPHTGNPHYIYIAGRTQNGEYIIGDPDRKNPHHQPISGQRLMSMMSRRDGFVAGWKDSMSMASRAPGSAANRYAMARYTGEDDQRARV
ncbi:MAG: hypothetical protein JST44_15145 [Cyanobacteria bacterium SZAS LIN-5]|nr:hypothetical protein [Cyanobacteria bacterium SZAS LIN-5]